MYDLNLALITIFLSYTRELSGYLVTLLMSTWEDENVHLPYIKVNIKTILIIIFLTHVVLLLFTYNMINVQDGYELRKQILGQLLTLKENECEENMPTGVLDFISFIRKIKET
jgi:hypothetical protein